MLLFSARDLKESNEGKTAKFIFGTCNFLKMIFLLFLNVNFAAIFAV